MRKRIAKEQKRKGETVMATVQQFCETIGVSLSVELGIQGENHVGRIKFHHHFEINDFRGYLNSF